MVAAHLSGEARVGRRPSLAEPPACPRPGHAATRVTLGGRYGSPARQLFRCTDAQGRVHKFAGTLPRLVTDEAVCQHCDNAVHSHQGPVVTRDYAFALRLASQALIDVGRGITYTDAAARARVAAGKGPYTGREVSGALVAEWVDVFAPVLLRAHAATAWPETLLVDQTNFFITNRRTSRKTQGFVVIGMYGYAEGKERGELVGLYASHEHHATDYRAAFAYVEALGNERSGKTGRWAPPVMTVSDEEPALLSALRANWRGADAPYIKRCEWHLRRNVIKRLTKDGAQSFGDPMMDLLNEAFTTPRDWAAFTAAAQTYPHTAKYVNRAKAAVDIADQVARRADLPQHHATGALEQVMGRLRPHLERRAFTFRNQRRMNKLLGLVRNHELRVDQLDAYAELLREEAHASGGRIGNQRLGYCAGRKYDLRP